MKYFIPFCIILCGYTTLIAQNLIPNPYFQNVGLGPCPSDSTQMIKVAESWIIYQTTDGTIDGDKDTSCFQVATMNNSELRIFLQNINPNNPLFLRNTFENWTPIVLESNELIQAQAGFTGSPGLLWKTGQNCPDDLCTGMFFGLSIPDSNFVGTTTRYQTALASPSPVQPLPTVCYSADVQSCLVTEYFDGQFMNECIFKFTFDPLTLLADSYIDVRIDYLSPFSGANGNKTYLTEITAKPDHAVSNNVFQVPLWSTVNRTGWQGDAVIAKYDATTYPSAANHHYIEVKPEPNTFDPKIIELLVSQDYSLVFQPFVGLRGAFTADSTARHTVILDNQGGNLCVNFWDAIFENGNTYRHSGGQIEFNNAFSCMQFRQGSALQVTNNSTLHFGNNGSGMLVLSEGGSIEIEPGSSLVVDAVLSLSETRCHQKEEQIYMDLHEGAALHFTDNAFLTNRFSLGNKMKLNIRMMGGDLDISALDANEKALINLQYPEKNPNHIENWMLSPNPNMGKMELSVWASDVQETQIAVFDLHGKMCYASNFSAAKGYNTIPLQHNLPNGLYFLRLTNEAGSVSRSFVVGQ